MFRHLLLVMLLLLPVSLFSADDFKCPKINQGDWAVVLVRGLNLDQGKELTKVEDFISLLKENNIEPQNGWKPSTTIAESDYLGTLGKALIYLNTQKSSKKQEDFNKFFTFLEDKVGLDLAQLLSILPRNANLQNLNEGLANYVATKQNATEGVSQTTSGENPTEPSGKSKGTRTSPTSLASVAPSISTLADALTVYNSGASDPDYWNVFSKPASPILPD